MMFYGRVQSGGMSSEQVHPPHAGTLDPALLAALVDDAAVFPPGGSPLPEAVGAHLDRLGADLARWTGPLLVPAAEAVTLPGLVGDRPLRVSVVARPGTDLTVLVEAVAALAGTTVEVAAVELGWATGWQAALDLAPGVVVELPRQARAQALAEVVDARPLAPEHGLLVKWRTGATPSWPWPDAEETAGVLAEVIGHGLPLKLTGGLHHLLPADHGTADAPDPQHGLLGVLQAVRLGAAGAPVADLVAALRETRPAPLVADLVTMGAGEVAAVRAVLRSYGCCTVTDPLSELAELGLLPDPETPPGDPA